MGCGRLDLTFTQRLEVASFFKSLHLTSPLIK